MQKIIIFLSILILPIISNANQSKDYFNKLDIAILQNDLQNHKISCKEVVDHYIERIKLYDLACSKAAPFNSILSLNPNIYKYSSEIDAQIKAGKSLKPLTCVPILLKDLIDDADMKTTMGSLAFLDVQPKEDAAIVKQLKSQGAIILGKANLDEMAMNLMGYSSYLGRTGNSYDSSQSPGGSSGGSGVAASLGFALVTIGTDNSGSIRIPASFNGVYGLRPTYGQLDLAGIFPHSNADLTVGPLTRNLNDLAKIDEVLLGKKLLPLNENAISGKRIGALSYVNDENQYLLASPEIDRIYNFFIAKLQTKGGMVSQDQRLINVNLLRQSNMLGANEKVSAYLKSHGSKIKSLQEFCNSGLTIVLGDSKSCSNYFASFGPDEGEAKMELAQKFAQNQQRIVKFMDENRFDFLLHPIVSKGLPSYDPVGLNTVLSSNSGLPAIVLLIGQNHLGMPVGMELLARPGQEKELLDMAASVKAQIYSSPEPKLPALDKQDEKVVNLSIEEFNALKLKIGQTTFERFLKNQGKVSSQDFQKLVREIVKELK